MTNIYSFKKAYRDSTKSALRLISLKIIECLIICETWWIYCQKTVLWISTMFFYWLTLPLFVRSRLHTGASQETQNEASPILLFHLPLYGWCTLTIIYHKFGGFVDHICPIEFEINDTQIQLGLLHTITYTLKNTVSVGYERNC